MSLNRRHFLQLGLGGAGALAGLRFLRPLAAGAGDAAPAAVGLAGQRMVRSTCSPNCTGACGFMAGVREGRIATLLQAADYPEAEYNPRGCLRGLSTMNLIYSKDRLKTPLIRTGPRGSARFRRASWDEALDHVAERLRAVAERHGPEAVALTVQVPGTGFVQKGALVALAKMNDWSIHHGYDQNGDLPMFWPMTFGVQTEELESAEWARARYTMVWGSNIVQTRLPDAQHLLRARENGKLVVIDPDRCATASKADEWLAPAPDSDAALALGMAAVIVAEKRYDADFVRDFTDLPLLVREDTGKRLRAEEVLSLAGRAEQLAIPDYRSRFVYARDDRLRVLDPTSLASTRAELEVDREVELVAGDRVRVRSVFSRLREMLLRDYTPERAAAVTGVPAATIVRVARELASTRPLHVIYGASNYQWYHGDLKGRAISLLPVLTGNLGRSGAGLSTLAGQYRIPFDVSAWWFPDRGELNWVPYLHFLQGGGPRYPDRGIRAMVGGWGNPFDQHNLADSLRRKAREGELDFILTLDFQLTTSCAWSDVVLPVPSWYEKWDLTATPLHPYLQLQQPAIEPLFESRSELWIARELARRLCPGGETHYHPHLDERAAARRAIAQLLADGGETTAGIDLAMLERGPVRMHRPTPDDRQIPFWEQVQQRRPFPPRTHPPPLAATARFVRSGRIEFYKDEDAFLAGGEQLPLHKPTFAETELARDPQALEKYPLHFVTKNSLYRVHSTHANNPWLLELQDHQPKLFINPDDATERGIRADDRVQAFNARGTVRGRAVLDPGCRRGTVFFEQGWWSRYLAGDSFNSLTMPWIKPLHEVYFVPGVWSPTTAWNECLCQVRRLA